MRSKVKLWREDGAGGQGGKPHASTCSLGYDPALQVTV